MSSPVLIAAQLPEAVWRQPICDPKTGLVDPKGLWGSQLKFLPILAQATIALTGSHANRLQTIPSNYQLGSVFFETDRRLAYVAIGQIWVFAYGILDITQDSLPNDLGANDQGLIVYVSDYAHSLMWDGAEWIWGPGDAGSGYTAAFISNQSPGVGWQLCDGTSEVPYLLGDGTLDYVDVPSTAGTYFRQ